MMFYIFLVSIVLVLNFTLGSLIEQSILPNQVPSQNRILSGTYTTPNGGSYYGAEWVNLQTIQRPTATNASSFFGTTTAMTSEFLFVSAPATCGYFATSVTCSAVTTTSAGYAANNNGVGAGGNGIGYGSVFVYKQVDSQWTQTQSLTIGSGSYEFGYAIALQGYTAVISAPRSGSIIQDNSHDVFNEPSSSIGAVYVYKYSSVSGLWSLSQTLTQSSFTVGSNSYPVQNFGASLALTPDLNTLVIGAPFKNIMAGSSSVNVTGSVWIYTLGSGSYALAGSGSGKGFIVTPSTSAWFGFKVAIGHTPITSYSGYNTIVVTSLEGTQNSLYTFSLSSAGGTWVTASVFHGTGTKTFGYTLIFVNQTLVTTDYADAGNVGSAGSVYTYQWSAGSSNFAQSQKLVLGSGSLDGFGVAVTPGDNNTFAVVASTHSSNTMNGAAEGVYVYTRTSSSASFTTSYSPSSSQYYGFIQTPAAFAFTSFVSMITSPTPQILVGGNDLESIYCGKLNTMCTYL